jgi:hypothetical protein
LARTILEIELSSPPHPFSVMKFDDEEKAFAIEGAVQKPWKANGSQTRSFPMAFLQLGAARL